MTRFLFAGALVLVFVGWSPVARSQGVRPGLNQVSPCFNPSSSQCLQSRIDLLSSGLDEATNTITALRKEVTAMQNSIGQGKGKADGGFDDLWSAVDNINTRLKKLER